MKALSTLARKPVHGCGTIEARAIGGHGASARRPATVNRRV
jgi:hypothetical protein